jgi:putative methyltransferase (TIGR04325 family)
MTSRELKRRFLASRPLRRGYKTIERLLPPLLSDAIRYRLSEWEYLPDGWPPNDVDANGWDAESVAAAQEEHWPVLVRNVTGTGPLGVSHLPSQVTREHRGDHNAMMSYGYVLARVARNRDTVSILDWGGGIGHYYSYSKALLPELGLDYHCYEVPALCRLGRTVLPAAHFHEGTDTLAGSRFDLVISSSSLHYFRLWRETACALADRTEQFLHVARLQTVESSPSFVVRQRPYGQPYNTEFVSWFINRRELIECIERAGLELVREFVFAEDWKVKGAPEQGECRGFLFKRGE